jgi:Transposase Tn5 dimerisation domain
MDAADRSACREFRRRLEIAQMYATRWLEEEFHKALKTGMGVERLQLTTAHEWFAATAMMSIAALRLIDLRETVRQNPQAPAEAAGLSQLELEVLRARTEKPLLAAGEVALALGRLGGHLNRKSDGLPGWITLWRGWQILQTLVEGVLIARKLTNSG